MRQGCSQNSSTTYVNRKSRLPHISDQTVQDRWRRFYQSTSCKIAVTLLLLISLVGLVAFNRPSQQVHASPTDHLPSLGINFNAPGIGGDRVFADAMTSGRPHWDTQVGDGAAPVDSNGWPTADASNMVWEGVGHNDGTYHLIFTGQATLSTSFNYGVFSNQQYDAATNTTTADMVVTDTGGENFSLIFTNTKRTANSPTNTGITNVKLMRPIAEGSSTYYDSSVTFTTHYKAAIAPYTYIRFMAGTNWNTSVNWSDRTRPLEFNQHKTLPNESGFEANNIAYEYMIQLCNETGKDCYLNLPLKVNDEYVTKLAQLIKYGSDGVNPYTSPQSNPVFAPLRSDLKVYLEYSNEVWNWSFQQSHDLVDLARAEVNAGGSNLTYDGDNRDAAIAWRYYARRIMQISNLFRGVFGDSAIKNQVRPLLEWQYDNGQETASQELNFLNNYYNNADGKNHVSDPHPVNYYLWGGGGAVYYNSNNDAAGTVDGIYASGIPSTGYQHTLNVEAAWAHAFGLHDVAYEGGFAVGGDGSSGAQAQSRFDPRAKQSMLDSYNDFAAAGGDLYTAGTYAQWDNIYDAANAPLVQAAVQINGASYTTPAVTLGIAVSNSGATTVDPTTDSLGNGFNRPTTGQNGFFLLNAPADGTYSLTITTNQSGGTENGQAQAFINDQVIGNTQNMPASSTISFGKISLHAGLNSLRILTVHGSSDPAYPNDAFHYQWQPSAITLTPAS